jgi:hypothetical protein
MMRWDLIYPPDKWDSLQERQNEKTISHFHTLICSALMILGIIVSASILTGNGLLFNTVPLSIGIGSFICAFGVYILLLPIFTVCLEIFLLFSRPIIQVDK